jgi:gas vesicle protein
MIHFFALMVLGGIVGSIAVMLTARRKAQDQRRLESRLENFFEEYDRAPSDAAAPASAG